MMYQIAFLLTLAAFIPSAWAGCGCGGKKPPEEQMFLATGEDSDKEDKEDKEDREDREDKDDSSLATGEEKQDREEESV